MEALRNPFDWLDAKYVTYFLGSVCVTTMLPLSGLWSRGGNKQFLPGIFPDGTSPDPKVPVRCETRNRIFFGSGHIYQGKTQLFFMVNFLPDWNKIYYQEEIFQKRLILFVEDKGNNCGYHFPLSAIKTHLSSIFFYCCTLCTRM